MVRPEHRLTRLGLLLAGVFWLIDSTIHHFAYGEPEFELLPSDGNELWMRSAIVVMFGLFGWYASVASARRHALELERARNERLAEALSATFGEYLPICAHCRSVRDKDDTWRQLEEYINERTYTSFTHGICPECMERYYPGLGNRSHERDG